VKLRDRDLDAPSADAAIAAARTRVVGLLKPNSDAGDGATHPPQRQSLTTMRGNAAMDVLARRLDHIEHAARKVARLAARPVIEDI